MEIEIERLYEKLGSLYTLIEKMDKERNELKKKIRELKKENKELKKQLIKK